MILSLLIFVYWFYYFISTLFMDLTKIMCWNCRGVLGRDTSTHIWHMIKTHNPLIFCLVETRADSVRLEKFCNRLGRAWHWAAILLEGYSGGIIIIWKKHIGRVTPMARSRSALHLVITPDNQKSWVLFTIYNSNRIHGQRLLWNELSGMSSANLPWIVIGDFNTVCSDEEARGGSFSYYRRKAREFSNFIIANSFLDVRFIGNNFTWCNNQRGLARRMARLDYCLTNALWSDIGATFFVKHLSRIFFGSLSLSSYYLSSFFFKN